jgi:rod shape-determining protein MreC
MKIRPLDFGYREDTDRRARRLLGWVLVLSIAGALLHRLPAVSTARAWLIEPAKPVLVLIGSVRLAFLTGLTPEARATEPRDEILRLSHEAASDRVARLERELNELRSSIGLDPLAPTEDIVASVTAHVFGMNQRTLVINRGSSSGVRIGSVVTAAAGDHVGLVGRVVEVGPGMAKVVTIIDPSARIPARLGDQGGFVYTGLSQRSEGRLDYVPRDLTVREGDEIRTSADGTLFPEGVLIGRVRRLGDGGAIFHEVIVDPAVELERIRYVRVGAAS